MADISFAEDYTFEDNAEEDAGIEEEFEDEMKMRQDEQDASANLFNIDPDKFLPPVVKLQKYADSDMIFNRQVVARSIVDALRAVVCNKEDVDSVMLIVSKISNDVEPSVRAELMEQIPLIASFCQEQNGYLKSMVGQNLIPIIVKYLTDVNNQWNIFSQVRKAAQISLLLLLEQQLIEKGQLEEEICPLVLQLTEEDNMDDLRTESISLMSKIARLVGKEVTEQIFLDRFASLCLDASFHVRKVCATNFGEFCSVVGRDTTQGVLLAKFYQLCDDGIWGVRKACADVFMPISCICSMEIRQSDLAPVFVNLLCDQSKWVRTAAFQALGPFISTFADPKKTGLCYDEDGIRVLDGVEIDVESEQPQEKEQSSPVGIVISDESSSSSVVVVSSAGQISPTENSKRRHSSNGDLNTFFSSGVASERRLSAGSQPLTVSEKNNLLHVHLDSESAFDHFQFWRVPIPDLELDIGLADGRATSIHVRASVHAGDIYTSNVDIKFKPGTAENATDQVGEVTSSMKCTRLNNVGHGSNLMPSYDTSSNFGNDSHLSCMPGLVDLSKGVKPFGIDTNTYRHILSIEEQSKVHVLEQDIVPSDLLEQYLSMTDNIKAQSIDPEVARFCAYSFPAVALTLGRKHWTCLRSTFRILSMDMRWKVRRTVAASMHELAVILGSDLAAKELVPTFENFMKDLDEVRIGILHHLARFLKLLRPSERRFFLPRLQYFFTPDNDRNWRFRLTLAEQLIEMVDLYSPSDVKESLLPISFLLIKDKVCEVRQVTLQLIAVILRRIGQGSNPHLLKGILSELVEHFIRAHKWSVRQAFVLLCEQLMLEGSMSEEQFAVDVLPHLLSLCWDNVANVRLAVARCISHTLFAFEYFSSSQNPHHGVLVEALQILKQDGDRDVRFFAHLPHSH